MGAIPFRGGTTFRVWAPHADAVFVTGPFDDWAGTRTALARDGDGGAAARGPPTSTGSGAARSTGSRSARPTATCRGWTRMRGR